DAGGAGPARVPLRAGGPVRHHGRRRALFRGHPARRRRARPGLLPRRVLGPGRGAAGPPPAHGAVRRRSIPRGGRAAGKRPPRCRDHGPGHRLRHPGGHLEVGPARWTGRRFRARRPARDPDVRLLRRGSGRDGLGGHPGPQGTMKPFDPAGLRRWPDIESPELQAHDGADLLLLETAAATGLLPGADGSVVVVDDHYGALTLGARAQGATGIRVHQDPLSGERALVANAGRLGPDTGGYVHLPLDASLFAGATVVLLQLPRSLDALEEIADLVARHADPSVVLLAGGRVKHMNLAMNQVLSHY